MTSDATVMTKPVWRAYPFSLAPRPTTISRRARSLMSSTRGHTTVRASIPSWLPW